MPETKAEAVQDWMERMGPSWVLAAIDLKVAVETERHAKADETAEEIQQWVRQMGPQWVLKTIVRASEARTLAAGDPLPTCATCRHFQDRFPHAPNNRDGACRRFPPTTSTFPLVTTNDWCGEHQPRPSS